MTCDHGTEEIVRVKVPADLSHMGADHWRDYGIDACIAPIVRALQEGGIDMRGSCCGHGNALGEILLADGRTLVVLNATPCVEWEDQFRHLAWVCCPWCGRPTATHPPPISSGDHPLSPETPNG